MMFKRVGEGLVGALLGGVVASGLSYSSSTGINWPFVYLFMGICFVLGCAIGGGFLQWVADLIHHV